MTVYTLEVSTKRDVPDDVVVEHVGYALRGIVDPNKRRSDNGGVTVRLVEAKRPRNHPFEGPVTWDDDVPETAPGVYLFNEKGVINQVFRAIGEDFPHLAELFRDKRTQEPPAEGDWQLNNDDKVGEDL